MTRKKQIVAFLIFLLLGIVAAQLPLTQIVGSKIKFTVFDLFGPTAGAFLGSFAGVAAVLLIQLFNFLIHGAKAVDASMVIRLFPMLFAVWYFAKARKANILVPILAIIAFNLHPIGRSAWYYSMYWLIPIICEFLRERFLLARALGATFTAHAVGGSLWVWTFGLSKAVWTSLIPIVALERSVFAVGIAVTYLALNNILAILNDRQIIKTSSFFNPKFVWNKLLTHKT